jgi:hypothetical protein
MTAQTGIVNIHGREYETVALRVKKLRTDKPAWAITTEVLHRDPECVVMKATIADDTGRVLGTGHAEEYRQSSSINKTSALENCETSAIGRALAAAGYGGTEFASADELKRAIVDKQEAKPNTAMQVCRDEYDRMDEEEKQFLQNIAANIVALVQEGRNAEAWDLCNKNLQQEEQLALWSLLDSKTRSAVNKGKAERKAA